MESTPLYLFNSMGRELQKFESILPGQVRLYTCGLTVYDYAHIGNLRAYVFTDTLRRVLQWKGYDVLHVMNITDVGHLTSDADTGEDKMEKAAAKQHRTVWELAQFYTEHFQEDLKLLGIQEPSILVKATDHIQEMIRFAEICEERGYTYMLEDGLYFDTSRVPDYGKLGLLDLEGMQEGKRVTTRGEKRNLSDFAVWRLSPTDKQRLMEWRSPWGTGAPGWHLECSVMSLKYLGPRFDIHTGGIDHRQVHHPNEVAQNQAFLGDGDSGVNYWLHNEFLVIDKEKMSKSKGDFLRLKHVIDWGFHPVIYRYLLLQGTYRAQLDFSMEAMLAARAAFTRLLRRIEELRAQADLSRWIDWVNDTRFARGASYTTLIRHLQEEMPEAARTWIDKLDQALSQDLNTPQAVALLGEVVGQTTLPADVLMRLVVVFDLALGLQLLTLKGSDLNLRPAAATLTAEEVDALLQERREARAARDFKRSDAIRDQLLREGIAIMDSPSGTTWEWTPRA